MCYFWCDMIKDWYGKSYSIFLHDYFSIIDLMYKLPLLKYKKATCFTFSGTFCRYFHIKRQFEASDGAMAQLRLWVRFPFYKEYLYLNFFALASRQIASLNSTNQHATSSQIGGVALGSQVPFLSYARDTAWS